MKRINLLPGDAQVKARRERGVVYALLGLVVLVAILGVVYVWQNNQVAARQTELASVQGDVAKQDVLIKANKPFEALEKQRTTMKLAATQIYNARVSWSSILEEISLVIPSDVRLKSITASVPQYMQPGAAKAAAGTATTSGDVTLTGVAPTHDSVAEFMTRLGLLPQLANINLTDSQEVAPTEGSTAAAYVTYTITASLRPYLTPPPATNVSSGGGK
jgi:Tfp pilus assembly protein PilN